ncbi:MAG TPA: MraY family glycosyltransferase [Sedimentisphaerales bacterium]|nr:MraY family glycosyltransferase [Sedimentisphaerales bacterium]
MDISGSHAKILLGLAVGAGAVGLSALLTAGVRRWAIKTDFVARPSEDRHHRTVIPMGGGIAFFWAMAITGAGALAAAFLFGDRLAEFGLAAPGQPQFVGRLREAVVIGLCLLGMHILGLWDDKRKLGPGFKLLCQFAAAIAMALFADVRVELFIHNSLVTGLLSSVWIVLIINAFNFLDNMDGLSAGIATIAASILLCAAAMNGQTLVAGFTIAFIGTMLGFLVFNFPPARIFMGDAGSMVIGTTMAILTLKTTYYRQEVGGNWYAVFMPLIVMAVPLYDFISVTVLRLRQGKSPFVGDTQHFSHRLKRRGLSDRQTALTLYLATLCTGLGALFLYQLNWLGATGVLMQVLMILAIVAILEATGKGKNNDPSNRQN